MKEKRVCKRYTQSFKEEAVALITEQGYSAQQAADSLGIRTNMLYRWKQQQEQQSSKELLSEDERAELNRLRKEVKHLRMEKEILKKGERLLCARNEVKYGFISRQSIAFPITLLCTVMNVSRSAYYARNKRPAKIIRSAELHLYRHLKTLFKASRNSLGSRELSKKLREEGFHIGRYRTRTLMRRLNLKVLQRIAYKVTTKCKHSDAVADDLLNRIFNPIDSNEVWGGDITYRASILRRCH